MFEQWNWIHVHCPKQGTTCSVVWQALSICQGRGKESTEKWWNLQKAFSTLYKTAVGTVCSSKKVLGIIYLNFVYFFIIGLFIWAESLPYKAAVFPHLVLCDKPMFDLLVKVMCAVWIWAPDLGLPTHTVQLCKSPKALQSRNVSWVQVKKKLRWWRLCNGQIMTTFYGCRLYLKVF